MVRKELVFGILLVFSLSFVSALGLGINSENVVDTVINDGGEPAVVDFNIFNGGSGGDFEIFIFEKFIVEPSEFSLGEDKSVKLRVKFTPEGSSLEEVGSVRFPVFFREKGGSDTVEEEIFIKLVDFDGAFSFKAENVNPEADSLTLTFFNLENINYDKIDLVFSSSFFKDREASISLGRNEKKIFAIPISKADFKQLVSGNYFISAEYTVDGITSVIEAPVKLLESSGISVSEDSSGLIIDTKTINKHNEGNIPTIADVVVVKNIISRLFTTFSTEPQRVERAGFSVEYFWQKELQPDETLSVKVTTNWIFPLLILISIVAILYLFNLYMATNVVVRKKVSFVRTRGGEFALKVTLKVKAKKFVEKVVLYDRLPAMAHLYNRYGDSPEDFNKVSGRLQWDVGHLGDGEERVFSYVLYSKMKIIGKFELPSAVAMYEMMGKLHEAKSNRSFFINEPREIREDEE
jgi:hypothetical protein